MVKGRSTHFSRDVAREVTQPEWPSKVPRWMSCSAMIAVVSRTGKREIVMARLNFSTSLTFNVTISWVLAKKRSWQ